MKTLATILAVSAAGWVTTVAAQDNPEDDAPERLFDSSWSLDVLTTWSNNFRRLPDQLTRFDVDQGAGTVDEVLADIDPPSNTIVSSALRGTTLWQRSRIAGFITGSVRLGAYLEDTGINGDLVADSTPAAPFSAIPDASGNVSTFGLVDGEDVFIVPDIVGAGTIKLTEDLIYLDLSAQARRQNILTNSTLSRRNSVAADSDTVTTVGFSVSPYLFHEWRDRQQVEVRARVSGVLVAEEESGAQLNSPTSSLDEDDQVSNDSYSSELSAAYDSGGRLGNVAFGLAAIGRNLREEGSDVLDEVEADILSAEGTIAYAVNEALKLTMTAGVDEVTLDIQDADPQAVSDEEDELSGGFWNLGFVYEPSRWLSVALSGGERYGGTSLEGNIDFKPSQNLTVNASAVRVLDTGAQELNTALRQFQGRVASLFSRMNSQQNQLSANNLGRSLSASTVGQALDSGFRPGLFVFDRYALALLGDYRRTRFALSLGYEEAENGGRETERVNFIADFERSLNRRLSVNLGYGYTESEGFGVSSLLEDQTVFGDVTTDSHIVDAGIEYKLGRRLTATASVIYALSNSDGETAVTTAGTDYEETAITIGLRWLF